MHVLQLDRGSRYRGPKPVDILAHVVEPDRVDRGRANGVPGRCQLTPDRILELLEPGHDLLATLEEEPAFWRQLPRPLGAVDELRAQTPFELANRLARRRLADGVCRRAFRETLMADHVTEDLQGLEIHGHTVSRCCLMASTYSISITYVMTGHKVRRPRGRAAPKPLVEATRRRRVWSPYASTSHTAGRIAAAPLPFRRYCDTSKSRCQEVGDSGQSRAPELERATLTARWGPSVLAFLSPSLVSG